MELRAWKDLDICTPPSDMTAHYYQRLPTNKMTHYVLTEANFKAPNEIEGPHEEPDHDFKANI